MGKFNQGGSSVNFGYATPKRHFLVWNRVFWSILRQNRCRHFGRGRLEKSKNDWRS